MLMPHALHSSERSSVGCATRGANASKRSKEAADSHEASSRRVSLLLHAWPPLHAAIPPPLMAATRPKRRTKRKPRARRRPPPPLSAPQTHHWPIRGG